MKKLKFLAALAAMLLVLTACGAKDNELPVTLIPDTTDAAPTEAPTEVPTQTPTQAPTRKRRKPGRSNSRRACWRTTA